MIKEERRARDRHLLFSRCLSFAITRNFVARKTMFCHEYPSPALKEFMAIGWRGEEQAQSSEVLLGSVSTKSNREHLKKSI